MRASKRHARCGGAKLTDPASCLCQSLKPWPQVAGRQSLVVFIFFIACTPWGFSDFPGSGVSTPNMAPLRDCFPRKLWLRLFNTSSTNIITRKRAFAMNSFSLAIPIFALILRRHRARYGVSKNNLRKLIMGLKFCACRRVWRGKCVGKASHRNTDFCKSSFNSGSTV